MQWLDMNYILVTNTNVRHQTISFLYLYVTKAKSFPTTGIVQFALLCETGSSAYIKKLQKITK